MLVLNAVICRSSTRFLNCRTAAGRCIAFVCCPGIIRLCCVQSSDMRDEPSASALSVAACMCDHPACTPPDMLSCCAGVYAKGGPTTVDKKITLASLTDRTTTEKGMVHT